MLSEEGEKIKLHLQEEKNAAETSINPQLVTKDLPKGDEKSNAAYIVIRHAERLDQVSNPKEEDLKDTDPGITDPNGRFQARSTGEELGHWIDTAKIAGVIPSGPKKIVLISSPYLRTLQTALEVIGSLKKTGYELYEDCIFLEDGFVEKQKDSANKGLDRWPPVKIDRKDTEEIKEYMKSEHNYDFHGCITKRREI